MKKSTSWGQVAGWYDEHLKEKDTYHSAVILPNLLRLLDIKPKQTILDLGCGQGFFSRACAAAGAQVVAADISPELIALAKKQPSKNIQYLVAPANKLSGVADNTIDTALIVLAIQNIEDMQGVFKECNRVLKSTGRLIVVLNHPAFRVPQHTDWEYDAEKNVQYRRVDTYLSETKIKIFMHPGAKPDEYTISFHRPMQVYMKALTKQGFGLTRLEEWTSHRTTAAGPRAKAENQARHEIPLFLMLEARKMPN